MPTPIDLTPLIYESTVYPGATEEDCVPVLEKFNQDFFCGYSPERINPGDTPEIGKKVDKLYSSIITSIKVAKVIERYKYSFCNTNDVLAAAGIFFQEV